MTSIGRWFVTLACAAAALPQASLAQQAPVATIDTGTLRGSIRDGIASWKGIAFAAPPVGPLRWRAPQPARSWPGVREATAYRNDCMQQPFPSDAAPLGTAPAEDCLYANIWKPARAKAKLPVLVWIYGGGFVNGGASPPTYAGDALARQGILVMSFNYRLGRFGTFAHPQLTKAAADDGLIGNYGYLDQIAALKWVKRNIAAFGGDPENVTIVGESAGGVSVHMLLASPLAKGLFDKAVIMSGGNGRPMTSADLAATEQVGLAFAKSKGIAAADPDALAKLRGLSAQEVTDGLNMMALFAPPTGERTYASPFTDGKIAVDAHAAYTSGNFAHVPVMVGATSADMGGRTGMMVAGARETAASLVAQGVPVWEYRFSYVADSVASTGAQHATDIPFFFDTAAIKYGARTSPKDVRIAGTMSAYLVNFAKRGNPNGGALPPWPRYRPGSDTMMDFSASGDAMPEKDPWGPEIDAAAAAMAH